MRFLLLQPDASTMPKPNIEPPRINDSQASRGPANRLLAARTQPRPTMVLKPITATAMASTHMRRRVQSPMVITSAIAPLVQKRVCWATAPNSTASAKAHHNTVVLNASMSISGMTGLSRP